MCSCGMKSIGVSLIAYNSLSFKSYISILVVCEYPIAIPPAVLNCFGIPLTRLCPNAGARELLERFGMKASMSRRGTKRVISKTT